MERLYIAYGSNLNLEQMAARCPTAKVVGATRLEDRKLVFRGAKGLSVATVEPCEGIDVPVLLWDLQPQDEAALDRYEGYPNFYRKEDAQVDIDGERITAMVYVMNEGHPLGQPSPNYYATIFNGYLAAGFDVEFLRHAAEDSAGEMLW